MSLPGRLFFAALMALTADFCLSGAYFLMQVHHWIPWAVALLLLEPLGVFSAFAVAFLIAPDSFVADWFAFFVARAKAALYLLGAAAAGLMLSGLILKLGDTIRP